MSRDMTITVECDGKDCQEALEIDLDDGDWNEIPDMKIEKALEEYGWYFNMDGDYCRDCKDNAKKKWNSQ